MNGTTEGCLTAAAGLLLALGLGSAQADGGSYRWVDEDGNVHYGDTMPPEARGGSHSRLDESGQVIDTFDAAVDGLRETAAEQTEDADAAQAERDRVLLQSFATERDIILTRDDRLAGVDTQIMLVERKIEQLQRRLEGMADSDATDVAERRQRARERIELQREALNRHRERRAEIEARFEADLERFRQLQAAGSPD